MNSTPDDPGTPETSSAVSAEARAVRIVASIVSGFGHLTEFFRNQILPPRPYFITTVLAVLVVDFGIRGAISYVTSDAASQGFRTWASTPGFGGLAAVVAASIAALSLRAQLQHNKRIDRERAWWQSFEWAVEHALSLGENSSAIPAEMATAMIQPLLDHNPTNLQVMACRGVMKVLFAPQPHEAGEVLVETFHDKEGEAEPGTIDGDPTEQSPVSEPAVEPEHETVAMWRAFQLANRLGQRHQDRRVMIELLESLAERTRGTAAASPELEEYLYQMTAEAALKEIATAYRWYLRRGTEEDLSHSGMPMPDFVIVDKQNRFVNVMLVTRAASGPAIRRLHSFMLRAKEASEPWLILSKKSRGELSNDTFGWIQTDNFSGSDRTRIEIEVLRLLASPFPPHQ